MGHVKYYLVINPGSVERDVDGVGGGIVVRFQVGLLLGFVANDKVHDGSRRLSGPKRPQTATVNQ